MKIVYTDHLKLRLQIRKIPFEYPKIILENPENSFFDLSDNRRIAIKRLKYNGKLRDLMIAYDITDNRIEIITIHPISNEKIINRMMSGRWLKK